MSYNFLEGSRIIESSAFIAAPLAGLTLAQFGADVIRIDVPGGGIDYRRLPLSPEGRSVYWTGLNKGKRSFVVDIRQPEGKEIVKELVTRKDSANNQGGVLLTNMGAAWLSHSELSKSRDDVITCTIEGSTDGTTAVDYTVNCAAGFPYMTGHATRNSPVNHVLPAWDVACAYQASFAIASALNRRNQFGLGAELRIALSDIAFSVLSHLGFTTEAELLEHDREPIGNFLYGAFGCDFETKDGQRIYVAAISINQWKGLINACNASEEISNLESQLKLNFLDEGDRFNAREMIAKILKTWIRSHEINEIRSCFNENGVCWGIYRTVRDAIKEDPRLSIKNPIFENIITAGVGQHLAAGSAVRIMQEKRSIIKPAPWLGADTDEILLDVIGLDSGTVGRLHDRGIVAGPNKDPFKN